MLLIGVPGAPAQEPIHGPFRFAEQNPFFRLFHTPRAEGADPLPSGTLRVEGGLGYTNVFELSDGPSHFHLLDLERLTTDVVLRWSPASHWEIGGGLRTSSDWGGFLDSFISGFHQAFGFPNGGREEVENGQYAFVLREDDRDVELRVPQERFALDDARFFVKRSLIRRDDGRGVLSVRGVVSSALRSETFGAGRTDVAAELMGRWSWARAHLHGTLGATTLTAPEELDSFSRERAFYLVAGGERLLTDGVSLVAQMVGGTSYFEGLGFGQLDGSPMNLVFGLAGGGGRDWGWQLSFAEDLPPGTPSVDFTVGLSVSRTTGGR